MLLHAESEPGGGVATSELPAYPLRLRAIAAAREALLRMRSVEEIGDDAFHQIEEELDRAEWVRGRESGRSPRRLNLSSEAPVQRADRNRCL
jgi:hypothetical protein